MADVKTETRGSPRNDQPGTPSSPPPSPEGSPPKGSPDRKRNRSASPSRSPKRRRHDSPTSRRAESPRRGDPRDRRGGSPPRRGHSPRRNYSPRRGDPRDRSPPRRDYGRRDDNRGPPRRDFGRPQTDARERSIYIGNLPYDIRRDEVRVLCEKYGEVYSVTLGARGFGFVAMDPRGAQLAVSGLDGRLFGRRTLHVNEAFVEPGRGR